MALFRRRPRRGWIGGEFKCAVVGRECLLPRRRCLVGRLWLAWRLRLARRLGLSRLRFRLGRLGLGVWLGIRLESVLGLAVVLV